VLVGAVLTVVALFYYLVVAKRMYIEPPDPAAGRIRPSGTLALAVILCALGVVALGVYPKPIVMAALRIATPLF
jgi:NADH-quinone oxidoreductase subunit N